MENKYALITGATSGIGYSLAKKFAEIRYNLVIVDHDESELYRTASELQEEYGIEVIALAKNLCDVENAFEVYNEVQQRNIQIDVLVNDGGQSLCEKFIDSNIYWELDIIQLNISSLVVLTKLFLTDMVSRGNGKILNLTCAENKVPGPWQSVYHAVKAFVLSFSEALSEEVKDKGVVVTALMPCATDHDFFEKAGMANPNAFESMVATPFHY